MQALHIGQIEIPYDITRTSRQSIGLAVEEDKTLSVRAPHEASNDDIHNAITSRKDWILSKLWLINEEEPEPPQKNYVSGEKLRYKGRRYPLKTFQADEPRLTFENQTFHLAQPTQDEHQRRQQAQTTVKNWFHEKAQDHLLVRTKKYQDELGYEPEHLKVQPLSSAWGACKENTVQLHPRLIHAPQRIIDYVIVHELVHLREPTHSDTFWSKLQAILPDYQDRKEWLRIHGNTLKP